MAHSLSLVLALLLLVASAPAGAQVYLELRGVSQGPIAGDVADPVDPDTISITELDWSSRYDLSGQTGQPTGRRASSFVRFVKPRDSASVPMQRALGDFERLDTCEFRRYVPNQVGSRSLETRIRLVDAFLVSRDTRIDASGAEIETWTVSYQSAEWSHEPAGEVFLDTVPSTGP